MGAFAFTYRGNVDPPCQLSHATLLDDALDSAHPALAPLNAALGMVLVDGNIPTRFGLNGRLDAVYWVQEHPHERVASRPRGCELGVVLCRT